MYSQEHHIISSDDEETVVPMKLIRSDLLILPEPPDDPNSYEELYKYSMEKCEFCESIFHCRYDVIIHNAKHIIVPLINQTTHKCTTCLYVFTSEQELQHHRYVKHSIVSPPEVQKSFLRKPTVVNENDNVPKVLENFVTKEPIVKCDDSVAMLVKSSNLKSRLVFEDEDDDVICLDEEPTRMNGVNFETSANSLIQDMVNNKLEQTLNGVNSVNRKQNFTPKLKVLLPSQVNLEKLPPSVHYQLLLKPGLYRCKRCTKTFPNRFILIGHETKHMRFEKHIESHLCTQCDKHIAGSREKLNNHMKSFHPHSDLSKTLAAATCHDCKLTFHNAWRHSIHYHGDLPKCFCDYCGKRFYNSHDLSTHYSECKQSYAVAFKSFCDYCGKRFYNIHEQSTHYNECKQSYAFAFKQFTDNQLPKKTLTKEIEENNCDIIKVCEVCAMFLKDKHNVKYICVGENSKLECNQVCQQCNKEAYVIKLVKRVKINLKFKGENKARTLSHNENRLKNIQQRLKFMNKLSRC